MYTHTHTQCNMFSFPLKQTLVTPPPDSLWGCYHHFPNKTSPTRPYLRLLSTHTSFQRTHFQRPDESCYSAWTEASLARPRLWWSCRCVPAAPGPWGWRRRPRSGPPWLMFPEQPAHRCFLPECTHPRTTPASERGGPTCYLQRRAGQEAFTTGVEKMSV